jgi:hypothetical protein
MHNHRIVPAGVASLQIDSGIVYGKHFSGSKLTFYAEHDTVPCPSDWTAEELKALVEIMPHEWNDIYDQYYTDFHDYCSFYQYLSDLISLAPLKGLSKEQIGELKKLNEVKL